MERRPTILDYLAQVFMIFGITILLLNIFCLLFGESAREFSTIFALGSQGLCVKTMLQFLLAIAVTIVLRCIFTTDLLIQKMPLALRIVMLFITSFLNIVVFILICSWFPADNSIAWIMFLLSFAISCMISTAISMYKEKLENRRLAEALQRLKEEANETIHIS